MSGSSVNLLILLAILFIHSARISAFWFATEAPKQTNSRAFYQSPQPDYYRPYLPPAYPYVPFQVPIPAQLAPATVQNVQLVPCLCPVNQDYVSGAGVGYDADILKRKSHYIQDLQQHQQQQQQQQQQQHQK